MALAFFVTALLELARCRFPGCPGAADPDPFPPVPAADVTVDDLVAVEF